MDPWVTIDIETISASTELSAARIDDGVFRRLLHEAPTICSKASLLIGDVFMPHNISLKRESSASHSMEHSRLVYIDIIVVRIDDCAASAHHTHSIAVCVPSRNVRGIYK